MISGGGGCEPDRCPTQVARRERLPSAQVTGPGGGKRRSEGEGLPSPGAGVLSTGQRMVVPGVRVAKHMTQPGARMPLAALNTVPRSAAPRRAASPQDGGSRNSGSCNETDTDPQRQCIPRHLMVNQVRGGDRVRGHEDCTWQAAAAGLRPVRTDLEPALHRVEPGPRVRQAPAARTPPATTATTAG